MEQIINRLKEEKNEVEIPYRQLGFEAGFEWALDAHYVEIQSVIKCDNIVDTCTDNHDIKEYLGELIMDNKEMDWTMWCYRQPDTNTINFLEGWQEGVIAFWDRVKTAI